MTFKEYVEAYYRGKDFSAVPGIWYKDQGLVHRNPPRPMIHNIDDLPSPAFDLFDMEQYIAHFFQLDSWRPGAPGSAVLRTGASPNPPASRRRSQT